MKININSIHFKADIKLEAFIEEKLAKLVSLYDGIIGGEVMLRLENNDKLDNKIAEIRVLLPGYDLFAKKQSKTFEEATDTAIDALRKQLIKHKEKIRG